MNTMKISLLTVVFTLAGIGFSQAQNEQPAPTVKNKKTQNVTDAELQEFANVYGKINVVNQKTQQKMVSTVKENGFEVQNFQKLQKKSQTEEGTGLSEERQAEFDKTVQALNSIQQNSQQQAMKIIKGSELTVKRYQQIIGAINKDKSLQERLKSMMQPSKKKG